MKSVITRIFTVCMLFAAGGVNASESVYDTLKSGNHVAIMRHAIAPGTGDPSHFSLKDCATQRNLSAEGQQQATAIGDALRNAGITSVSVYSSQWCRCLETARLLNFDMVQELPFLNSFYEARENEESQTQQLRKWLASFTGSTPTVLVTHQVNITALTGVYPASGEIVIVRVDADGNIEVVETIRQ